MFIGLFTGKLKTGKDQTPSIMSRNKIFSFHSRKGRVPTAAKDYPGHSNGRDLLFLATGSKYIYQCFLEQEENYFYELGQRNQLYKLN